ncbi:MAG: hypothetical protein JSS56_18870 [Proteobacteria bacterium]|nr:hypothetical protein [Pseudomonadota bacterium]
MFDMTVDNEWISKVLPLGSADRLSSSMTSACSKLRANVFGDGNQGVDMMVNNIRLGLSVNTTVDKKLHPPQNARMSQKIRVGVLEIPPWP